LHIQHLRDLLARIHLTTIAIRAIERMRSPCRRSIVRNVLYNICHWSLSSPHRKTRSVLNETNNHHEWNRGYNAPLRDRRINGTINYFSHRC